MVSWITNLWVTMGVSLFLALMIMVESGLTMLGMSLLIFYWLIIVWIERKSKTRQDYLVAGMVVFFAISLIIWANPVIVFLSFWAAVYLGLVLVSPGISSDLFMLIVAPIGVLLDLAKVKVESTRLGTKGIKIEGGNWLGQASVSILLLVIILPILGSASPVFESYLKIVIEPIDWVLNQVLHLDLSLVMPRLALAGIIFALSYKLPWVARAENGSVATSKQWVMLIPKILVATVLAIFLFSQVQLYMASSEMLARIGYSHSSQAREVFGQLAVVSVIVLALLYKDKRVNKKDVWLTYLLIVELVFLNIMSLKSVIEYISAWGLTEKRLWGLTGVVVLYWISVVFVQYLRGKIVISRMSNLIVMGCSLILVGVNLINFDYVIYHFGATRTGEGKDHSYLSYLSTDTFAVRDHVDELARVLDGGVGLREIEIEGVYATEINKIRSLRTKYENFDFRKFNFSEWWVYQTTKDLDLNEMERRIRGNYE